MLNIKILVVDDEEMNQLLLIEILGALPFFTVDVVSDGKQAVDYCMQNKVNLILMDIHMPNMNGIEATKRIRKIKGYEKVVIIMQSASVNSDEEAFAAGATYFWTKPLVDIEIKLNKLFKNKTT